MPISQFGTQQYAYNMAATSSGGVKSTSPKSTGVQVSELLPELRQRRHASLIKLTDECLAAINNAIKNEWRIKIVVEKENIMIHVGNGTAASPTVFQCSQQVLPGAVDAICRDPSTNGAYQTVSSLNTKIVVNATEKTFAETRMKAQKLAEEESKKMAKDIVTRNNPISRHHTGKISTLFKPSTTSTLKMTNGFTTSTTTTHQKRISPPFPSQANRTASPSVKPPPNVPVQNKQELLKKSLRERCIHLLATGKYRKRSDLLERLKFEGAPKNENIDDFLANAKKIVKEVSEYDSSNDSLQLRPQFLKEVNLKWPWFLSSEREQLRRLIGVTNPAVEESAVVAPTRRNEIVAPVAPSTDRQLISSSTTTDRSSSFNSKQFMPSTKPSTSEPVPYSSLNSKSTPDSLSAVETAGLKETQNVRPTRSVEKQPTSKTQTSIQISSDNGVNKDRHHRKELQGRQSVPIIKQSISNDALQRFNMQQEDKLKLSPLTAAHSSMISTDSQKRPSTTKSSILDNSTQKQKRPRLGDFENNNIKPQKSCLSNKVWMLDPHHLEREFPVVRDSKQAMRYHEIFHTDYPLYRKCYDELTDVSKKFNDLKTMFDRAPVGSEKQSELLDQIQRTYDKYKADGHFAHTKQQHARLHARLSLLKRRVADWEKNTPDQDSKKVTNYRRERSASPGGSTTYSSVSAESTESLENGHVELFF